MSEKMIQETKPIKIKWMYKGSELQPYQVNFDWNYAGTITIGEDVSIIHHHEMQSLKVCNISICKDYVMVNIK